MSFLFLAREKKAENRPCFPIISILLCRILKGASERSQKVIRLRHTFLIILTGGRRASVERSGVSCLLFVREKAENRLSPAIIGRFLLRTLVILVWWGAWSRGVVCCFCCSPAKKRAENRPSPISSRLLGCIFVTCVNAPRAPPRAGGLACIMGTPCRPSAS